MTLIKKQTFGTFVKKAVPVKSTKEKCTPDKNNQTPKLSKLSKDKLNQIIGGKGFCHIP
jgi:bacteriocin-like protein